MYLVNQRVILLVKMTVLLGVPLLCSFIVPWLDIWKLPSVVLVLTGYYLNNLYPDRILMEEGAIGIKLFLFNDWFTYKPEQVQYQRTERCVYLYIDGKKRYRLSLEKLSVRLYMQITEMLKPYCETINK
ncbi:MAG: hypothetical protein IJA90_01000 [Peptococcaceae bacterium]|nr:hypothetical protein [Peptococcaceae bacterium]